MHLLNAGLVRSSGCLLTLLLASVAMAAPRGKTERVSLDSHGEECANGGSDDSTISATGRFVAFDSRAEDLVPGDTNGKFDIFARDRRTGKTRRVSVSSSGAESIGGDSYFPSISGNGRFIAFESSATNLVEGDTNDATDVFVHDLKTGKTTRVSVSSEGAQGNQTSDHAAISANGRYVAFESLATNLVEGDTNLRTDILVHDRKTKRTVRVSVDSNGVQANGACLQPSISAKGRSVAFYSEATNLVEGDTNGCTDVFVHDLKSGVTTRLSVTTSGEQVTHGESTYPSISANGRFVAFSSSATDLVPDDTNGERDVFVVDRKTGVVTRESVDSNGAQATTGGSDEPALSRTGRFLAFRSHASNLVANDTNAIADTFLRDRKTGKTTRVSVGSHGAQATQDSYYVAISGNGKCVIFTSSAENLVADDTNQESDTFVRVR